MTTEATPGALGSNAKLGHVEHDALQAAWQKIVEHCYGNGLGDALMTVRAGYAAELNSERQARKSMVHDAVAKERERCAKIVEGMDTSGHDGYIETTSDLLEALAGRIRRAA